MCFFIQIKLASIEPCSKWQLLTVFLEKMRRVLNDFRVKPAELLPPCALGSGKF